MGVAGELTTIGLAEVLQNLAFNRLTGTLTLEQGGDRARIAVEEGRIRAVRVGDRKLDYVEIARHAQAAPEEVLEKAATTKRRRTLKAYLHASGAFDDQAYVAMVAGFVQEEIAVTRGWRQENLLVRMSTRLGEGGRREGYVVAFDDVTDLVTAQRMAAWGDVARRIAHEIKNPLTPIQLSADRLRRKFVHRLGEDGARFEHYISVITRQAGDIRRMVDEFSRFARMPEPQLAEDDLAAIIRDAVTLQSEGHGEIAYETHLPDGPQPIICDRGLIAQCLTNLMQNAADAIAARQAGNSGAPPGRICVALASGGRFYRVTVADNGIGLPGEGRDRLTDPYVTTRSSGTGLGLAIVRKIIEQHDGELWLADAGGAEGLDGAAVGFRLPRPAGPGRALPAPAEAASAE